MDNTVTSLSQYDKNKQEHVLNVLILTGINHLQQRLHSNQRLLSQGIVRTVSLTLSNPSLVSGTIAQSSFGAC